MDFTSMTETVSETNCLDLTQSRAPTRTIMAGEILPHRGRSRSVEQVHMLLTQGINYSRLTQSAADDSRFRHITNVEFISI